MNGFLLLEQHAPRFEVADPGYHGTLHDCTTLIIFDVAHPFRLLERDLLCKALLLKIPNGIIVGIGEKVHDVGGSLDVVFEMRHEVGAIAFDLLVRGDGAEDDFSELSTFERAVCDAADVREPEKSSIEFGPLTYPTTSSGFFTIAMDKCVRS